MGAPYLQAIDWTRPWLAPLRAVAAPILAATDVRLALNVAAAAQMLQNKRGLPIRFVPQEELPTGMAYEAFIHDTGRVPTRDNLHDFFNALVWLSFPKIKVQLNALQEAEISKAADKKTGKNVCSARGKLRDAATIFDENAALLLVSDPGLVDALQHHQWRDAFIARRLAFGPACEVRLFGHALMEKLVKPYKAITAHAWVVEVDKAFFAMPAHEKQMQIDRQVAMQLAHGLSTSDFTPLPVLGIPEWAENQDEEFYEDAAVFRPKRALAFKHGT